MRHPWDFTSHTSRRRNLYVYIYILSSGGWIKIKLKKLPHFHVSDIYIHVVCQFNPTLPLQQQLAQSMFTYETHVDRNTKEQTKAKLTLPIYKHMYDHSSACRRTTYEYFAFFAVVGVQTLSRAERAVPCSAPALRRRASLSTGEVACPTCTVALSRVYSRLCRPINARFTRQSRAQELFWASSVSCF